VIGVVTLTSPAHRQTTSGDADNEDEKYIIGRSLLENTTEDRYVTDSLVNDAIMVCFAFLSS